VVIGPAAAPEETVRHNRATEQDLSMPVTIERLMAAVNLNVTNDLQPVMNRRVEPSR
jgi:hypothetical protein